MNILLTMNYETIRRILIINCVTKNNTNIEVCRLLYKILMSFTNKLQTTTFMTRKFLIRILP